MMTAREEYDDLVNFLSEQTKKELEAIPFAELPIDAFQLNSFIRTIPKDILELHGALVRNIVKLNTRMMLEQTKPVIQKEELVALTPEIMKDVSLPDISDVLSTSIKKDESAKLITFLGMLLAQTNSDQQNIGFQSESAAGKSYIALELAAFFPVEEIMTIASASPTAFYHSGKWIEETKSLLVDLEHKIVIFLDMPHYLLLEKMRPVLSHDQKELTYKITDKSQKYGLKTKDVVIRGYPTVIFCSAKLDSDEQERTRLILLSPSTEQDKLKESITLVSLRKSDPVTYAKLIGEDPKRMWLVCRVRAIRQTRIRDVIIPDHEKAVRDRFLSEHPYLKARHQRDFPRVISLIKAHALLNCFNRKRTNDTIEATQEDVEAGFALYKEIEESNEMGLSPYVFKIYSDVIKPLLVPEIGLKRKDIRKKFFQAFHKPVTRESLQDVLDQLETAALIEQEVDPDDRRSKLVYPP